MRNKKDGGVMRGSVATGVGEVKKIGLWNGLQFVPHGTACIYVRVGSISIFDSIKQP